MARRPNGSAHRCGSTNRTLVPDARPGPPTNASPAIPATRSTDPRRSVAGAPLGTRAHERTRARASHHPDALPDERLTDAALRPSRLDEFVASEGKGVAADAHRRSKQRREPLDHTLFFGRLVGQNNSRPSDGQGAGSQHSTTSGLSRAPRRSVAMLTSLGAGDILFIDECTACGPCSKSSSIRRWRLPRGRPDRRRGSTRRPSHGPERFTLIGATTSSASDAADARRVGLVDALVLSPDDCQIISRSSILGPSRPMPQA